MDPDISLKSIITENNKYTLRSIEHTHNKCGTILYSLSDDELLDNFMNNIQTKGFDIIVNNRDTCHYYQDHLIILLSSLYTLSIKKINKTKASIFVNFSNDTLNIGRSNTTFNFNNPKDFFNRLRDIVLNQLKKTAHINGIIKFKFNAFLEYLEETYNDQNFYNIYFE